jgi:transposase
MISGQSSVQLLIPNPAKRFDGKGRPWKEARDVMKGVLWILLCTVAPWYDMPDRYPQHQKCYHSRFPQWVGASGVFEKISSSNIIN